MNKNLIVPLSAIVLLYFSCSKSKNSDNGPQNTTPAPVKITLVSGSGQSDTVGLQLANSIVVSVTQNGQPLGGYSVEFQGSGCNKDLTYTTITSADGTASYIWHLAGDVGQQTLKAYALNSQSQKVDSAGATATGFAASSGWQYSACSLNGGGSINTYCKISSGRLFACYPGKSFLRYSDDNGASWYAVTALGNSHNVTWALSTIADELFVFAEDGTYYSKDAGQTWSTLNAAPFAAEQVNAGISTPDGKLIVAAKNEVSVSADKGQTWIKTSASSFNAPQTTGGDDNFSSPTEDQTGNLYVNGLESGTTYESTDGGNSWSAVAKSQYEMDFSFYVDNSTGWYYKVRWDPEAGGLYVSKDQGANYTKLVSAPNIFLAQFSVQSDGNYYYETGDNQQSLGLFQSGGITSSVKLIRDLITTQSAPYIVAKNGNIVTFVNDIQTVYFQK